MDVAAWERERDARGGGLGLARPLVSHRGVLSTDGGLALDTVPYGRHLLTRRLLRPVSARPAGGAAELRGRPPQPVLLSAIGLVTPSSGTVHSVALPYLISASSPYHHRIAAATLKITLS